MSAPHDLDRRLDDWLQDGPSRRTRALDRGRPRPRRHAPAAARPAGGPAARPDGLGRVRHGRAAVGAARGGRWACCSWRRWPWLRSAACSRSNPSSCRRCRRPRRRHPWRRRRRPPRPARRARSRAPRRPRPGWTSSTTSVAMPTSRSRTSPGRWSGRARVSRPRPVRPAATSARTTSPAIRRRSSCPGSAARRTRATS